MTEGVFDMLRAARNIARFQQIRHVTTRRAEVVCRFLGRNEDIDGAILAWANYEQAKRRPD